MNLVLRFSALGDVVHCSAFTQALQGETLFVTSENLKPFVEENFPGPLRVYGIPRPTGGLVGWFAAGMQFAGFLRLYASPRIPELRIYDLHNVTKSVLFTWGLQLGLSRSRIVEVLTLRRTPKQRLRRWMLLIFKRDIRSGRDASLPVYRRHLELLDHSAQGVKPRLGVRQTPLEFRSGQRELRLLVAPDAQHWKKIWPAEYWKTLLESLARLEGIRVHVTLVGNRAWIDSAWIKDRLLREHPHFSINDLQTRTALTELPQIAMDHHLTLCGNSAWQHISEAVGTPVLSLAGPIVPEFGFAPWLKDSREVSASLSCRPCTLHGDGVCYRLNEHHACMKQLTPRLVVQQMWQMLGFGSAPS